MSNLSAIPYITSPSAGTTGLWNQRYSVISANFAALNSDLTLSSPSGNTFSILSGLEVVGGGHFQYLSVGSTPPSYVTTAAITVEVNSAYSDYLYFIDSSAQKSSYVIGSRAGNLADGLNIWDASAGTMIASFSKQSIRFFQNVVGPVFDVGGSLTRTYNAATFGTGSQSTESRIQAAINQASTDAVPRVYIPANMYPYSASSISFIYSVQLVREGGNWGDYDVRAYGAAGNGSQDDTAAFTGAINTVIGNVAVPTMRFAAGPIYVPAGTYKITAPLRFQQVNGIKFSGAGISSQLQAGSRISSLIDIDGMGYGVFENFCTSAVAGSTVSTMILLHSSRGDLRGNSGIIFRQILIGLNATSTSSAFVTGIGMGTISTDSNIGMDGCNFERIFIFGAQTSANTLMYQWGFKIGPDTVANIEQMQFYNSEVVGCGVGLGFTGGAGCVFGGQFESNRTDFHITVLPSPVKIAGMRCEGSKQFMSTTASTGGVTGIDIDTVQFAGDAITSGGNQTIIDHGYSGMLTIRNFQIYAVSSSTATCRVVVNNGSGGSGLCVSVDGFSVTNNQTIEQTFTTQGPSPVAFLIRGFNSADAGGSVTSIVPSRIYNPVVVAGNVAPGLVTTAFSSGLTTKTSSYTATIGDCVVLADATASLITIGVQTAVGNTGLTYRIKKVDSSANRVMVASASGNIDGLASKALAVQYQSVDIASDGANWFIL